MERATRALIHLDNFKHNIRQIKSRTGKDIQICAAVKADAYGHGAVEICKAAIKEGVHCFGVATLEEGLELRNSGIKNPVIMYSLPFPDEMKDIVNSEISVFIADKKSIDLLAEESRKQQKPVNVHLKIDTGMGRIGCKPEDSIMLASYIKEKKLNLEGVCTHFPVSDEKTNDFTAKQIGIFNNCIENICDKVVVPRSVHAANSGAIIGYPDSYFNTVRPGIMLYGYYPSKEQKRILELKPVMEFVTKVSFIKTVEKDTPVSYGMTYRTKQKTKIATLPVGYADGYSRLLSNKAKVKINNKLYPVAGRVCMDQTMIDIGLDADINPGDDVMLFGADMITAEDTAYLMNTIPYEVTCLISKRVPRIYIS